jgi:nanoRNase/pAp phosphatase (c-di-AMP/oligoRNAs hydrolase)
MPKEHVCVYHTDGDGYASAAIVADHLGWDNVKFIPMNYDYDFPWEEIDGMIVYMVDFALQPFDRMVELFQRCKKLIWIDHHKSAIEEYKAYRDAGQAPVINGIRVIGSAACELTWQWFNPAKKVPHIIYLLGRYDVWALVIQMGFRAQVATDPQLLESRTFWSSVLRDDFGVYNSLLATGHTIKNHTEREHTRAAKSSCFMSEIDGVPVIAANVAGVNSKFFDSVLDLFPEARALLTFHYRHQCWSYSLYHIPDRDCPDLGAIAKRRGGGGHEGAAGFQVYKDGKFPIRLPLRAR